MLYVIRMPQSMPFLLYNLLVLRLLRLVSIVLVGQRENLEECGQIQEHLITACAKKLKFPS